MDNDNANGGYAFLVNKDVEGIGGTHNNTTALLYSWLWTAKQNQFVQDSINNIRKENPRFTSCIPFTQMKALLDHSCPGNAEKKRRAFGKFFA